MKKPRVGSDENWYARPDRRGVGKPLISIFLFIIVGIFLGVKVRFLVNEHSLVHVSLVLGLLYKVLSEHIYRC